MPLEFEENSPQKSGYTSAIPLPALESKTEAERRFAAAWSDKREMECLELVPKLPPHITTETLNLLITIALRPPLWRERWFGNAVKLRRKCVAYLAQSPTPLRLMTLKPLLFDRDEEVQEMAFEAFRRAGKESASILLEKLEGTLSAIAPNLPAHRRGILRVIDILSRWREVAAIPLLGDILLGNLPTYPFNGRLENALKYGAISIGVLSTGLLWSGMLSMGSWTGLLDLIIYVAFSLIGSTVIAGIFYVGSFTLCLPYLVYRDNRIQSHFRTEAIQALRRIGDKRALKSLMQAETGRSAKPLTRTAILELLPLLEADDTKWLGRTGRSWLTENLRESSSGDTLILLKATEILGNEAHIPPVLRMCKRGKSAEVRAEATRVLAVLESRRDAQQERRELLRASAMPDDYKETLLRPLQDRYAPQEERELLHPSDKPEE